MAQRSILNLPAVLSGRSGLFTVDTVEPSVMFDGIRWRDAVARGFVDGKWVEGLPLWPVLTIPAVFSVAENAPFTITLIADQAVTWAKTGGADAAAYTLVGNQLTLPAKDFENPTDAGADNTYVVELTATGVLAGLSTKFVITGTVTNVLEGTLAAITPTSGAADNATPAATVVLDLPALVEGEARSYIATTGPSFTFNAAGDLIRGAASFVTGTATGKVRQTRAGINTDTDVSIALTGEVLQTLTVSARSVSAEVASGTLIGTVTNLLTGSALSVVTGASFVAASGSNLVKGARSLRPGYHNVTVRETKGVQSKDTTLTLKAPRTGVLMDDFEDLATNWSGKTAGTAIHEANTAWSLTGKQSYRMAQPDTYFATVQATKTLAAQIAVPDDGTFEIAANVENLAKTHSFGVTLTNAANVSSSWTFDNLRLGVARYGKSIKSGSAGASFTGPIKSFNLKVFSNAAGVGGISFDTLRVGPKRIAPAILITDDGYSSTITTGHQYLKAKGAAKGKTWGLTLGLQRNIVGTVNAAQPRATLQQLVDFKANGGVIVNHTDMHADLSTLTQAQVEAELQGCIDYIQANGLSTTQTTTGRRCKGSEYHLVYPYGNSNAVVHAAMRAKGMLTGFNVMPRTMPQRDGMIGLYTLYRSGFANKTAAAIKAEIDAAVIDGNAIVLFVHDLDGSGIGTTLAIWQEVVDYLDTLDTAGSVEIMSLLDWYEQMTPEPLALAGVNLAGAEFGGQGVNDYHAYAATLDLSVANAMKGPAPNYAYPTPAELTYYADRGVTCIRLPFRYHHLFVAGATAADDTPRTSDWTKLNAFLDAAAARGVLVILDMHEYGYKTADGDPGNATAYHTAAVFYQNNAADKALLSQRWVNVAKQVKARAKLRYGLMNEPTSKPNAPGVADLFAILQAVITAVAAEDTNADHLFHVCGWGYSSGAGWVSSGNAAAFLALVDPRGGKPIAEVHQYLDVDPASPGTESHPGKEANPVILDLADSAGSYVYNGTTYTFAPALKAATEHARANGYKLFLGETATTQDAAYLNEGRRLKRYLHANRDVWDGFTDWGAGPLWQAMNADGTIRKPFSPEPRDLTDTLHLPQMNMLSEFLGVGA